MILKMGLKFRIKLCCLSAILFLLFLVLNNPIAAQNKIYGAGISSGISNFESLSASVTGIQLNASFEFPVWFSRAFNFKASLFYIRKTEFFLPEDKSNYYPYFYGASFSGIMRQRLKPPFFIEEHAGLMVLKNNFFSGISETNYGITFGAAGGIDLRAGSETGFLVSLGYNGGLTFNGNTPSFNSFLLHGQLFF